MGLQVFETNLQTQLRVESTHANRKIFLHLGKRMFCSVLLEIRPSDKEFYKTIDLYEIWLVVPIFLSLSRCR